MVRRKVAMDETYASERVSVTGQLGEAHVFSQDQAMINSAELGEENV
jgi:hypothetical protein